MHNTGALMHNSGAYFDNYGDAVQINSRVTNHRKLILWIKSD